MTLPPGPERAGGTNIEARGRYKTIDIAKSYAVFHKCIAYEGFPTKLNHLRPTDDLEGPGFYLISNLDWSNAPALRAVNESLGVPFQDLNVYARPELNYLRSMGVTFTVLEGVWAAGNVDTLDFTFPGEPERDGLGLLPLRNDWHARDSDWIRDRS